MWVRYARPGLRYFIPLAGSVADDTGSLLDLAIDFLNKVLESVKDPGTMLRAKVAQVDVATTELVDA